MTETKNRHSGLLGRRFVAEMGRITLDKIAPVVIEHARLNLPYLSRGRSLTELRGTVLGAGDSAIVVAAGPSIKRQLPGPKIKATGYKGAVIATDSGLAHCLRSGIVPDLVVTLDPHITRIVRWFGDPSLSVDGLHEDDYYRRQDMDESFANELKNNQELLDLVNRYGPQIRIALCTSAPPAVVERVLSAGMQVYWWNPMLDDPEVPDGLSWRLHRMNGLPCVNGGGNVGTTCWMLGHAVLGKRHIALTGIDFSYYEGTPFESTQYFHEIVALVGREKLDQVFMWVHNPYLDSLFYTDPAYMWYKEIFLEMARETECTTSNCTEGGILFGDPIRFEPLDDFLARHTA